ncbi:MAG: hypothetical protein CL927_12710 [Deltaproteobacteria bacterium]|nr:hypothetical protein [Deltaproteobacteria bacterium]
MHRRLVPSLALLILGCEPDPITADTLDKDWVDAIGWPEEASDAAPTAIITDPGAISGELSALLYGSECAVTWSVDGERTTCRDCEFAFDVLLDVVADPCGAGSAVAVTLSLGSGSVYVNDYRLASYDRIGNTITFNSLEDSGDTPEPYYYGYYDDYYYSSPNDYYGRLTLLAR